MAESGHGPGGGSLPPQSSGAAPSPSCAAHSHVIDLKTEVQHAVFVSHSRRDPAALNVAYAIVGAWRHGIDESTGEPFCAAALLPPAPAGGDGGAPASAGGGNKVCLWLDKEQMQESGGNDWNLILTKAQLRSLLSVYMLGNAYIGSAECMKEFQFGDMKQKTFIPIFLERFCQSEEEFEAQKQQWKPDRTRSEFDDFSSYRDVLERIAGPKQGAYTPMDMAEFVCEACKDTRDTVCLTCSDWTRALGTARSGAKFREAVVTVGRYIDAAARDHGLGSLERTRTDAMQLQRSQSATLQRTQPAAAAVLAKASSSPARVAEPVTPKNVSTIAGLAVLAEGTVDELMELDDEELTELMGELTLGILPRKRVLKDAAAQRLAGSPAGAPPPESEDAPEPAPEEASGGAEGAAAAAEAAAAGGGLEEVEPASAADLMDLSDDDHRRIFGFLRLADLAKVARLSKFWEGQVADEFMWEQRWRAEKGAVPLPVGESSYLVAYRDDVKAKRAFATGVQGCCVEVTDTYNIWSIARIMLVLDEHRFLVWFEGWGSIWLMWLDRRHDLARVRGCRPAGDGTQPAGMGKRGPISEQQFLQMQEVCIQRVLGRAPDTDQAELYEGGKWDGVPRANEWAVPKGPPARQNPVWPAPYWRDDDNDDDADDASDTDAESDAGQHEPAGEASAAAGGGGGAVEVGMRLEAVDKEYRSLVAPAEVVGVSPDGSELTIHFDGWGDAYAYIAGRDDPDLHYVGWCSDTGRDLQLPGKVSAFSKTGTAWPGWPAYLAAVGARAVPRGSVGSDIGGGAGGGGGGRRLTDGGGGGGRGGGRGG
eukprot:SAG22_NODE_45_length_24718_cov_12.462448_19_plen_820_part_01